MKIQIVSDLHLESASQRDWIKRNPLEVVGDILVLAGDIGSWKDVKELEEEEFISWATSHYKYVLMIHGNHSFMVQATSVLLRMVSSRRSMIISTMGLYVCRP